MRHILFCASLFVITACATQFPSTLKAGIYQTNTHRPSCLEHELPINEDIVSENVCVGHYSKSLSQFGVEAHCVGVFDILSNGSVAAHGAICNVGRDANYLSEFGELSTKEIDIATQMFESSVVSALLSHQFRLADNAANSGLRSLVFPTSFSLQGGGADVETVEYNAPSELVFEIPDELVILARQLEPVPRKLNNAPDPFRRAW